MTAQDRIDEYWTGRAPAYDAYQQRPERVAADRQVWSAVWSAALPDAPLDLLDVGTGSGQVAMILAGLGHRVTGIDLADGMLAEARRHAATTTHPPRFLRGDAVAPDFPPASFDAVVSRYVMWTLRDPETAVTTWRRLVRPGGLILAVDTVWFTAGPSSSSAGPAFYPDEAREAVPLATATSIDETAAVFERAGLAEVTVTPLRPVYDLDVEYGVSPGHDLRMQYLISGRG